MAEQPTPIDADTNNGVLPTEADQVTDPTMVPFDDDAGGPTADKEIVAEPSDDEIAAQLGDFA